MQHHIWHARCNATENQEELKYASLILIVIAIVGAHGATVQVLWISDPEMHL